MSKSSVGLSTYVNRTPGSLVMTINMLQSTWFTALLAIDEYRVEARRDACLCCLVHPGHVSAETAESAETGDTRGRSASVWTRLFSGLSRLLVTVPAKILVTLVTLGCLAGGIFGTLHLKMEFKPEWLMDPNSEGETIKESSATFKELKTIDLLTSVSSH